MTPVRSVERSNVPKSGSDSSAMNIVGTPYREVARSSCTARSVASGSNAAAGITAVARCETIASVPITIPKQWKNGTGRTTRSASVYPSSPPIEKPLLRML
jgi:hypothetical protein